MVTAREKKILDAFMDLRLAPNQIEQLANKLMLNSDKTEFMVITSQYYQAAHKLIRPTPSLGGVSVSASSALRNLGVTMDCTMTMKSQIQSVKCSMYNHLRSISKIRPFLDRSTCIKAVVSLVLSRLDYCNSLLVGQSTAALHDLQVAQNYAARVITGLNRGDHITATLEALHWLPVHQRVKHKLLCLLHKSLNSDVTPAYMPALVSRYVGGRTLRSSTDTTRLTVPRTRMSHGDRCFSVVAPTLWNQLHGELRAVTYDAFRKGLKTHLFREHYQPV